MRLQIQAQAIDAGSHGGLRRRLGQPRVHLRLDDRRRPITDPDLEGEPRTSRPRQMLGERVRRVHVDRAAATDIFAHRPAVANSRRCNHQFRIQTGARDQVRALIQLYGGA